MHAVVVVGAVAYRIVAVVVADVQTVAEVDYICHAFTGYALYRLAGEAESEVIADRLGHFYAWIYSGCLLGSRSFHCYGVGLRSCVRSCGGFCECVESNYCERESDERCK